MKLTRKTSWFIIIIFIILSAFVIFLLVTKSPPKNNIPLSELKEAKKQLQIELLRYEEALFSLDINHLPKEIERLSQIYPPYLIEPNVWYNTEKLDALKDYLQDTVMIALYHASKNAIKNDALLQTLETAFGYYKVLFPNDSIPTIITLIPGLVLDVPSVYINDDILYVNVDMYLGANNPYYKAVGMPVYIAERCEPVYLPVDIFKKAMVYKHLAKVPHTTLIDAMITEGKKLYFTEMMFPDWHERFIIGYAEEKYQWANEYLGNVWCYMIEKNELFGKGEALRRCYIEESPFTKPFGNNSPGRLGSFVGWKLVQSYMANNPEVTLPQLMQENDYQKILNSSKFKPVENGKR